MNVDSFRTAVRRAVGRIGSGGDASRRRPISAGHRFAHLVLEYRGQEVSLLITTDQGIGAVPPTLPVTDGFRATGFQDAGYAVFVVSALDEDEVREVAAAISGPVSRALEGA